jgi:hypothetical protein
MVWFFLFPRQFLKVQLTHWSAMMFWSFLFDFMATIGKPLPLCTQRWQAVSGISSESLFHLGILLLMALFDVALAQLASQEEAANT